MRVAGCMCCPWTPVAVGTATVPGACCSSHTDDAIVRLYAEREREVPMSVIRKVDDDSLAEAAEIIRRGGLVVVPTDTE